MNDEIDTTHEPKPPSIWKFLDSELLWIVILAANAWMITRNAIDNHWNWQDDFFVGCIVFFGYAVFRDWKAWMRRRRNGRA